MDRIVNRAVRLPSSALLAGQIAIAIVGVASLLLTPPASGAMLLVPLAPDSANGLAAAAIASGARPLAGGGAGGALIVRAERAAIVAPMVARGVLVLAAPETGCGAVAGGQAR